MVGSLEGPEAQPSLVALVKVQVKGLITTNFFYILYLKHPTLALLTSKMIKM